MIALNSSLSLAIKLGNAKTSFDMDVVGSVFDGSIYTPVCSRTNGISEVILVAAPDSGEMLVKSLTIYNADTISNVVTLYLKSATDIFIIGSMRVPAGETLFYDDGRLQLSEPRKQLGLYCLSADQTSNLSEGNNVAFNSARDGSDLIFDPVTYRVLLRAGKRYLLEAGLRVTFSAVGCIAFRNYNHTDGVVIGGHGLAYSVTTTSNLSNQNVAVGMIDCSKDIWAGVTITGPANVSAISAAYSYLKVVSL